MPLTKKSSAEDAVKALIAQLAVPSNEPVNEPKKDPVNPPSLEPKTTISSPLEPDFLMKATPSCVFKAISPNSREDVSGTLPGTAERRSFKNWLDMCPVSFGIY